MENIEATLGVDSDEESQIDDCTFVKLVECRPWLYDAEHPKYKNNMFKEETWRLIANSLGWEDDEGGLAVMKCKGTWKRLRDNFMRALRRLPSGAGADDIDVLRKKPLYDALMFLRKIKIKNTRKSSGNFNSLTPLSKKGKMSSPFGPREQWSASIIISNKHADEDTQGSENKENMSTEEPAKILREAIRNNSTLKDRVTIKIDNDMRHSEVRVDHWLMSAKVVDLPTIVESLKTIDGKGFYKTADICQMLLCREDDDQTTTDEDSPQKKKKDSNKVEKKYLWPHGITPPSKNIRKRRFRKTLKKKYVEAPEIEKEVKRLLRHDNDSASVKWEVINEEDENKVNKGIVIKKDPAEPPKHVAEHDIFGGAVSDSEEEDVQLNVMDVMDESQNSGDDSHLTDSNSVLNNSAGSKLLTEFTSDMFRDMQHSPSLTQDMDYYQQSTSSMSYSESHFRTPEQKVNIQVRLDEIEAELADLRGKRQQQEVKIENIENLALRQRFQDSLEGLLQEQIDKENEKYDLELLKQSMD